MTSDAPGTPCNRHLYPITILSMEDRQRVADILADFRVDELEETLGDYIVKTEDLLAAAAESVSRRFASGNRSFQEDAFNRVRALHVRVEDVKKEAIRAFEIANAENYEVKFVARMHDVWELDENVDDFMEELENVKLEAEDFLPVDREV